MKLHAYRFARHLLWLLMQAMFKCTLGARFCYLAFITIDSHGNAIGFSSPVKLLHNFIEEYHVKHYRA